MLLAQRPHFEDGLRRLLVRAGGATMAAGITIQAGLARWAIASQPPEVVSTVMQNPIYGVSLYAWIATAVLVALAGLLAALSPAPRILIAAAGALAVFLNIAATVMVRDGIRDVTLRAAGFEVWDRQVTTNWSVVGLFLVLFVGALGAMGYLIRVAAKARRIEEKYA